MKQKNGFVEVMRFVAALIMIVHHSYELGNDGNLRFVGGWIFVEYFFMLSGYFTTRHFSEVQIKRNESSKVAVAYTFHKIKRCLPYAFIGIMIDVIWKYISTQPKGWDFIIFLTRLPINFMLFGITGTVRVWYNAPLWYLSGLLFILPIFIIIIIKNSQFFKYYLSWVLPLALYGIMIVWHESVQYWNDLAGTRVQCILRTIAGLIVGALIYYLSSWLGKKEVSRINKIGLTFVEIGSLGVVIFFAYYTTAKSVDVDCVLLLLVSLVCTFSKQTYTNKINGCICNYLGKISMPIYCLHRPLERMVNLYGTYISYRDKLLISILLSIVLPALLLQIWQTVCHNKATQ